MASTIQLRRGTASQWSVANPILAQGEMGVETDTGQFKVGDGILAWASLPYGGLTGPAQTLSLESYGDGSDGNVSLAAGTTTLTRDMYYNNLTLSGTAKIATAGYRVFVKGTLDITAAGAFAINNNGGDAGAAVNQTGGAAGAAALGIMMGVSIAGTAGGTGVVGVGVAAAVPTGASPANGAVGGTGGLGGTGTSGAGGSARAGGTVASATPIRRWESNMLRGITLIQGGAGGGGAGSGAGDGVNLGRGGGGGGGGGGIVLVYAKTISRGAGTAASCISANGGVGTNGASSSLGTNGAGAGGGGGGGGWLYLAYENLIGATGTNILAASGGDSGAGGNAFSAPGTGGQSGTGGSGGRVTTFQSSTATGSETFGTTSAVANPAVGLTGGAAVAGNLVRVSL